MKRPTTRVYAKRTVAGSRHLSQRSEHAWHSVERAREEIFSWWKGAL
jgi:hypothetical protein